jgi:hypothetical protein
VDILQTQLFGKVQSGDRWNDEHRFEPLIRLGERNEKGAFLPEERNPLEWTVERRDRISFDEDAFAENVFQLPEIKAYAVFLE